MDYRKNSPDRATRHGVILLALSAAEGSEAKDPSAREGARHPRLHFGLDMAFSCR